MAGDAHFEIFPSRDGHRWRAQSANGIYTGHSDQAFDSDRDAERAIVDHVRTMLDALGADPFTHLSDVELREKLKIERVDS